MSKMTKEEQAEWYEQSRKHWRSWGSWFSWGSPVGLGLFLLAVAGAIWILSRIQHINRASLRRSIYNQLNIQGTVINYRKSGYIHLLLGLSALIACRIWRKGFELEPSSGTDFWLLILLLAGSCLVGSGLYRVLPFKYGSFWNSPARWYGTMAETWLSALTLFAVFMSYSLYSEFSTVGIALVIVALPVPP